MKLLSLFLGFFLAAGLLSAARGETSFETAVKAYDEGDFAAAREQWHRQAESGPRSANLFYNLGNADYRLGEKGKAILGYERALALAPGHPEATANLARVRQETGALLPRRPFWERALLLPQTGTRQRALWIAAVTFWAGVFALRLRRRAAGAGLLALFLWSAAAVGWQATRPDLWIVTRKQAAARLAPVDNSKRVAGLPEGSHVRLLLQRGGWLYILLPDGSRAWLPGDAATPLIPAAAPGGGSTDALAGFFPASACHFPGCALSKKET